MAWLKYSCCPRKLNTDCARKRKQGLYTFVQLPVEIRSACCITTKAVLGIQLVLSLFQFLNFFFKFAVPCVSYCHTTELNCVPYIHVFFVFALPCSYSQILLHLLVSISKVCKWTFELNIQLYVLN